MTAGIGLLPCPLTISVLGFAWAQGTAAMLALVLFSLALGIAATIGIVDVLNRPGAAGIVMPVIRDRHSGAGNRPGPPLTRA